MEVETGKLLGPKFPDLKVLLSSSNVRQYRVLKLCFALFGEPHLALLRTLFYLALYLRINSAKLGKHVVLRIELWSAECQVNVLSLWSYRV